ncbi:hypothetical protein QFC19_006279 [Naganishia cerealis]|uniref:Uncharacterized protein n=1 Tax=Naganishia cerealis TaxID=610337 RepID=A0ACC2VIP1_9TREE|nr:hypothetical protein QFC19_006279 [Naganishia cerealis]
MSFPPGNGIPPGPPAGFPPGVPGLLMLPPLAPNWSEHRAPNGTPYYYNNVTKQSTYVRPSVAAMPGVMPPFPPGIAAMPMAASPNIPVVAAPTKKKEKPKEKIPIPNTTWTKVITTEGNVFYTEKTSKKSSWTIPEEIKQEVEVYEAEQRAERIRKEEEERIKAEEEKLAVEKERERIRRELEEERRHKKEEEDKNRRLLEQQRAENEKKRKERETNETDASGEENDASRPTKLAKLNNEEADNGEEGGDDEDEDDEGQAGPEDEEDEEAWQKAVAAELAKEHAEQQAQKKAEKQAQKEAEEEAREAVFHAPTKVEFTTEEGRALFKALLYERNISHLAPWETSLPLFINDPRYVLLSSMKDRQDVFEEYCRDVARARRLGKSTPASGSAAAEKRDPEKAYRELLKAEVKSTRMLWDDFRRAWKKDRRFFEFGKDDRQREKTFRNYQKELGERKRADAKRAETDFMELLAEQGEIAADSKWAEVKRPLVRDPRYDAVGSSSLREELFKRYQANLGSSSQRLSAEEEAEKRAKAKKERAEASLREREQQVKEKQHQMERDLRRSKQGANREEAEREFGSLLVQAVREHNVSWPVALPLLEKDPRFQNPGLSPSDKQRMFNSHLESIARKRLEALHKLFESHSPKLNTPFEDVFPEIVNDFAVTRLNLTPEKLEQKYEQWQQVRFQEARKDFEGLLKENSFVDFWGRMRNKNIDEKAYIPENEDEDDDFGAEGGGKANLADMAKSVDLKEMHAVLRVSRSGIRSHSRAGINESLGSVE